jgi:hypothetical protein
VNDVYAAYIELCDKAIEEADKLKVRAETAGNKSLAGAAGTARGVIETQRKMAINKDVLGRDRVVSGPADTQVKLSEDQRARTWSTPSTKCSVIEESTSEQLLRVVPVVDANDHLSIAGQSLVNSASDEASASLVLQGTRLDFLHDWRRRSVGSEEKGFA